VLSFQLPHPGEGKKRKRGFGDFHPLKGHPKDLQALVNKRVSEQERVNSISFKTFHKLELVDPAGPDLSALSQLVASNFPSGNSFSQSP
jgi:hypothetical protein